VPGPSRRPFSRHAPALPAALALSALALLAAACDATPAPDAGPAPEQAPEPAAAQPARRDAPEPAATPAPAPGPRLVLLYVPCSVARRHLGPYADDVTWTPHLSRFARRARVFERHHTEAGLSGVAYAALLSGRRVFGHGVYAHPQFLGDDLYLMGEAFADAGFVGHFFDVQHMATEALNYTQGIPPLQRRHRPMRADDRYFRRALEALRRDPSRRSLVIATFLDNHWPYDADDVLAFCAAHPAACGSVARQSADEVAAHLALYAEHHMELSYDFGPAARRLGLEGERLERYADVVEAAYASTVARMDADFGAVLAAIEQAGLADESLVAFTTDHGEQMRDPGALLPWTHGHTLERAVIEIPWLLRGPDVPPGRTSEVTRSIDVYPTLAGLAGVDVPAEAALDGVDLAPALRGEAPFPELPAWFHTAVVRRNLFTAAADWTTFFALYPRTDPRLMWVGVRRGDRVWRYRHVGDDRFAFEAADWSGPRGERPARFDPDDPADAAAAEALRRYRERLVADYERRGNGGDHLISDRQKRELLRQLGYVR